MEIEVLEQNKNSIKFVLKGANHTFCNHLKNALYEDKNVKTAAYTINHPLVGTPTFMIEKTGTTSFNKILSDAAKNVQQQNKTLLAAFNKLK